MLSPKHCVNALHSDNDKTHIGNNNNNNNHDNVYGAVIMT